MLKAYHANKLGFLGEAEWRDLARSYAGAVTTPGGKLFMDGNKDIFNDFLDAIANTEPYAIDFSMGRGANAKD